MTWVLITDDGNGYKQIGRKHSIWRWRDMEEMTGKEIANFIQLQADEGKTPKEAIEALMKVIGAEMPDFKED